MNAAPPVPSPVPDVAPGAVPVATSARPLPPRKSLQGGRFARWHQPPGLAPEEDSWLLTYLDVMTLLLVMMVVMLAFSEPASHTPQAQASIPTPAPVPAAAEVVPPPPSPPPQAMSGEAPPGPLDQLPLDQLDANVTVIQGDGTVRFRISSELLFASGEAGLTPEGLRLLDTLLPTFNLAIDHNVVVEGHTDNVPINTPRYPSNWELAASRAGSVVRHLQARGLNPTRLRATGYAETRPIAPNHTAQGQRANRRVELMLALPRQDD